MPRPGPPCTEHHWRHRLDRHPVAGAGVRPAGCAADRRASGGAEAHDRARRLARGSSSIARGFAGQ